MFSQSEYAIIILFNKLKCCFNEVLYGMSLWYAFCWGDSAVFGRIHCDFVTTANSMGPSLKLLNCSFPTKNVLLTIDFVFLLLVWPVWLCAHERCTILIVRWCNAPVITF